jgi:hypothetical protein
MKMLKPLLVTAAVVVVVMAIVFRFAPAKARQLVIGA